MLRYLEKTAYRLFTFDETAFIKQFRNQQIPAEVLTTLTAYADNSEYTLYEYMFGYLYCECTDEETLNGVLSDFSQQYPAEYERYTNYEKSIWLDARYFPIPESQNNTAASVIYGDSWMQSRTFGGNRGHEGCDLMASINTRGYYPVISVSDGVIEQIGWLTQGGYRIGVRSPSGAYYYYAHLYDYAKSFERGEHISAGELLGFMGDSGYGEIEGTIGNFDVHLHFGIYLNTSGGEEFSVNSFSLLQHLEQNRYRCIY